MKKSQQIIGLPIISISDGNEVGKVKNIVLNAEKGTIDYFVVDSGIQVLSTRVIPTVNVLGIGEYAMTVLNPEAINDISKIPDAIDLLQKNITVKGTKVLTKKGSLIGETGDIFVDVDNGCNIVGIEYIADITQKKVRLIPRTSVITFGKNLLVVEDDVQENLLDDPSGLTEEFPPDSQKKNIYENIAFKPETDYQEPAAFYPEVSPYEQEQKGSGNTFTEDVFTEVEPAMEEPLTEENVSEEPEVEDRPTSEPVSEAETAQKKSTAAELFEERQRQYLRGRKSTKTISDNGGVIIRAGETITDQTIERAKNSGKLVELVMNNEA